MTTKITLSYVPAVHKYVNHVAEFDRYREEAKPDMEWTYTSPRPPLQPNFVVFIKRESLSCACNLLALCLTSCYGTFMVVRKIKAEGEGRTMEDAKCAAQEAWVEAIKMTRGLRNEARKVSLC